MVALMIFAQSEVTQKALMSAQGRSATGTNNEANAQKTRKMTASFTERTVWRERAVVSDGIVPTERAACRERTDETELPFGGHERRER